MLEGDSASSPYGSGLLHQKVIPCTHERDTVACITFVAVMSPLFKVSCLCFNSCAVCKRAPPAFAGVFQRVSRTN
jgi:hypothetical protein